MPVICYTSFFFVFGLGLEKYEKNKDPASDIDVDRYSESLDAKQTGKNYCKKFCLFVAACVSLTIFFSLSSLK